MASILLWTNIIFMHLSHLRTEQSMTGSLVFIPVAFLWSHSKISNLIHFLIQKHPNSKPWQIREFFIFYCLYNRLYFPVFIDLPCHFHIQNLLYGISYHCQMLHDQHTVLVLKHLYTVCSGIGNIIMCLFPFQFYIHIVIRRSPPNIQFHWMVNITSSGKLHVLKQSGTLI